MTAAAAGRRASWRGVPLFGIAAGGDLEVLCHDRSVVERRVRSPPVASDEYEAKLKQNSRRWCFSDDTSSDEAAAPAAGRIVLCDNQCEVEYVWMFSVHAQSIELRKLSRHSGRRAFPYELPWTISACL
ncbi:unnamed protein product [Urochloa humidicola]